MQSKSSRGVQQEEVFAAADALLAERLRPTIERVRMKIGRGSPNTVAPMLEAWFSGLGQRLGVVPAAAGEGGPPSAVRQAMDGVWAAALTAAREQADAALAAEREALASEHSDIQAACDEAARQQTALATREVTLNEGMSLVRKQLEEQGQRILQLQRELERRTQELADTRNSLAGLVQEREQRAIEAQQKLERLKAGWKENQTLQAAAAAGDSGAVGKKKVSCARLQLRALCVVLLVSDKQRRRGP